MALFNFPVLLQQLTLGEAKLSSTKTELVNTEVLRTWKLLIEFQVHQLFCSFSMID